MARVCALLLAVMALTACGRSDGTLKVAFIDQDGDLFATGNRLSPGAQHVRAALGSGLVALDERGEVVPALADRWIVTDDGLSFIFRLRDGRWPDGREMSGQSVRAALERAIRDLRGTSLGLELTSIAQVRAMAGRVVEIRLAEPVPSLLQLLAQPELTLSPSGSKGQAGPMVLERRGDLAVLTMKRPAERGLPEDEAWQRQVRPVSIRAYDAERAIELFDDGGVDVVLGGRLVDLPRAPTGPLSRGTVQLDPAIGLFGLQVRRAQGFLADAANRQALSMALDRAALIAPFNIGGWLPTASLVPPAIARGAGPESERWANAPLETLRAEAARRVANWRARHGGEPVTVTLAIEPGPGSTALIHGLTEQLAAIGIEMVPVQPGAASDLTVIDRVARYAERRWFLDQFNCRLRQGLCDAAADAMLRAAARESDPANRAQLLADAEAALTKAELFIPLGSPVRFSLVRSSVTGFAPNPWAFHPLPPLAAIPK